MQSANFFENTFRKAKNLHWLSREYLTWAQISDFAFFGQNLSSFGYFGPWSDFFEQKKSKNRKININKKQTLTARSNVEVNQR